jgi:hypothetical protein
MISTPASKTAALNLRRLTLLTRDIYTKTNLPIYSILRLTCTVVSEIKYNWRLEFVSNIQYIIKTSVN